MRPCINQLTTKTTPFEKDLAAYAAAGFDAVEVFLPKLEEYGQRNGYPQARRLVQDFGLEVVGACGGVMGMMLCQGAQKKERHDLLQHKLDQCAEIGAPVLNMVTDFPEEPSLAHYEVAEANLKEIVEMAGQRSVRVALEFVAWSHFLAGVPTTLQLIRAVNPVALGLMFDSMHFYKGNSKLEDLEQLHGTEIALVHVNDVPAIPREVVADQDRVVPGEGVIPLQQILAKLHSRGYDGPISAELLNPRLWEHDPEQLARAVFQALSRLCSAVTYISAEAGT